MRTVKEVSRLTGVSVRALHHYDAIGLLKPAETTEAGYRMYDDAALGRLQTILMFRELRFPLKEIKAILESPSFRQEEALEQQIRLLELQMEHIRGLISLAREMQGKQKTGNMEEEKMDFAAFDKKEMESYAEEVRRRWGSTGAYAEYAEKTKQKTDSEMEETGKRLLGLFSEIGALRQYRPEDGEVQEKIRALQGFITEHYYNCTEEILRGLGEMYVGDERMKHNIDQAGGEGTAEFVKRAVDVYTGA